MLKLLTVYLSISGLVYMQMAPAYAQRKDYSKEEESKGGAEGKADAEKSVEDLAKEKEKKDKEEKAKQESIDKETDDTKVTEASEDTASIVMTVLFLLVIMITAPIWVIWCPKPDTGLHAVAGVIAIVLEGVFWGLYEKGSKTALEIYERDAKTGYDIQLNSMKTAMEITQKAKTWMTAKFGVQIAIAVIIGIAMAVVLIMSIIQSVRSVGAETAIAQNCATTYNDSPFKGFDASKLYTSRGKPFDWAMSKYETLSRFSNCNDIGELAFINDEMERFSRGEINSAPISDYNIIQKDKEINSVVAENKPLFSQFKKILDDVSLMALAHAATPTDEASASTETGDKGLNSADIGSKLAAIGVVVPTLIAAIVLKVSTSWTVTAVNGWIRAGFYAAEIVFVGVVASFSKKTADELGRRADAYQGLYEQLVTIMANQPGKDGKTPTPMTPQQIYKNAGNAAVAEMDGKCFTGSSTGEATPDPSCGCKASKSCKKTNMPKMSFPDFKTPSVLASSSKLAGDMGDQMYSGDMRGASLSAQGLGRNAVAVKKMNDRLMALANSKMAEFGKPPIDFEKNKNDAISRFKNDIKSTWGGLSAAQQKEAIQAVMGGAAGEKKEEAEVASVGPTGGKGGAGSGAAGTKKKGIFDFVGDKDEKAKLQAGAEKEKEGKGLDEYEDSTKQITEGGEKNLFKIIEIRYMKSAYPVFFESPDK